MLPRAEMFKPDVVSATPHLGRAFTDAQEMRQVAGGTDFIRKTLAAFTPTTVRTTALVDLHCYDCFPALASLEECSEGRRVLCGSIVLDKPPEALSQRVANKVYEDARSGQLKINGFPNYAPVFGALQSTQPEEAGQKYQVTIKKHDRLVVLESLASKWLETEFKDETVALIDFHNKKFNPDGEYWQEAEERLGPTDEDDGDRPHKRIKLESAEISTEADVVNLQKPFRFQINNTAELVCGQDGAPLYLASRSKNQFLMHRELFSFGSGDWRTGNDASEVMEDSCGRWFSFCASAKTVILLEKKTLPNHLSSLPCVDAPTYLSTILRELEDAGEVKLAVTHHTVASIDKIEPEKPLTFLLDPPKPQDGEGEPKKKKLKKGETAGTMTAKNFGAILDISKFKKANRLVLGWRARLDSNNSSGTRTIVPIRPIACAAGVLDLGETVVKLY
ncbi:Uncharacterized protein SCF082_LOCUS32839 [Durusdinium trenchii]|uniref:Uncharacterized protein n=1 Tax=Durusdinium trenchii TaxID=1381693 RepID=A0ABP0LSS9_9DINO